MSLRISGYPAAGRLRVQEGQPGGLIIGRRLITLPGAPLSPSAIAGPLSATVTWTAPFDGNTPITNYTVVCIEDGTKNVTVGGGFTTANVTGLTAGTPYTFEIYATSLAGNGPNSSTTTPVTPTAPGISVPSAPISPSATAGINSATVSWSTPLSDGGSPITGYTVVCVEDNSKNVTVGLTTSANVTGLTAWTPYTFKVYATNAVGNGTYSSTTSAVQPDPAGPTVSGTIITNWDFRSPSIVVDGYSKVASLPSGLMSTVSSTLIPYAGNPAYSFVYQPTQINGRPAGLYNWVYMIPSPILTQPASDWLIGFVVDISSNGWLLDIDAGRLLIGNSQTYTDTDGFSPIGSPPSGPQIITAEFRAGSSSLRSYPMVGSPTGPYATNSYTQRPLGVAGGNETLGATYINSGGAGCSYGQVMIIQNPGASDEATLVAYLKSSWGI